MHCSLNISNSYLRNLCSYCLTSVTPNMQNPAQGAILGWNESSKWQNAGSVGLVVNTTEQVHLCLSLPPPCLMYNREEKWMGM